MFYKGDFCNLKINLLSKLPEFSLEDIDTTRNIAATLQQYCMGYIS